MIEARRSMVGRTLYISSLLRPVLRIRCLVLLRWPFLSLHALSIDLAAQCGSLFRDPGSSEARGAFQILSVAHSS